jgi:hypothetical protein
MKIMQKQVKPLAVFCALLAVCWTINAQPTGPTSGDSGSHKKYFRASGTDCEFEMRGADLKIIENTAFVCTPVKLLKTGEKVKAIGWNGEAWGDPFEPMQIGKDRIYYPTAGMLQGSGEWHGLFLATFKAKIDIKAGETLRSDGYKIDAKRPLKAGDSIPVYIFIDGGFMSLEATAEATKDSPASPWLTALNDDVSDSRRIVLLEAWRRMNNHIVTAN